MSTARCTGCNRRTRHTLWFGPPDHQLPYCERCAVARHQGCPCLAA